MHPRTRQDKAARPRSPQAKFGMIRVLGLLQTFWRIPG